MYRTLDRDRVRELHAATTSTSTITEPCADAGRHAWDAARHTRSLCDSRGVETATQTLHRLTSFTWAWYEPSRDDPDLVWTVPVDDPRVLKDLEVNDLDRLPWFYKRYGEDMPRVPLLRDLPPTATPAVGVLAGTAEVPSTPVDLPHLSRLLHLSAGVVRTMVLDRNSQGRKFRERTTWLFRAAGSAGGRFPLELYVAVPEGTSDLPPGVHWYQPEDHALVRIGPPPVGDAPVIVVTGIPWRTGWRYRERGFRHVYWDAGTMLAQLLAVADSAGHTASLHTRFPDAAAAALVGADRVHEWPVAVVALGDGTPALEATGDAVAGEVDAAPLEFPLVTHAQRAGEADMLGRPWDRGAPADVSVEGRDPIQTVVLARGSQKLMDPHRGLPEHTLRASMLAAMRGIRVPHFVVVHDVEGLAPGVYRWPDLSRPVRVGMLRQELYRLAMEQGLARDAAFVVIGATSVATVDDHGYREAQLAAGLVEGRLHLLAYALGASASGMTFIDSEVPATIGEPLDGLLFTCVGVPEYRSASGGLPGAPTNVRGVTPRVLDQDST